MSLRRQVLRFGGVGSIGFVIDGGLLWLLMTAGVDPYLARGLSFPVAVLATWWLNRAWTFDTAGRDRPGRQFSRYLMVQLAGVTGNYLVYAIVLHGFGTDRLTAFLGFALGSVAGMFINFFGARHAVFRAAR